MSRLAYATAVISAKCGEGKEVEEDDVGEEGKFKCQVTRWELDEVELTADGGDRKDEKYARVSWRVGEEERGVLHVEADYWLYAWLPEDAGKNDWEEDGPNDLAKEEKTVQKEIGTLVEALVRVAKEQARGWSDEESPLRQRWREEQGKRARRDESPSRQ